MTIGLRVAAYAVIVADGQMLLAHWNESWMSAWALPGGGLEPGEDPADTVVREVAEETGYDIVVDSLLGVDSEVIPSERRLAPGLPAQQQLRIIYAAHVTGGVLRDEVDGTTDTAAWFALEEIDALERVPAVDTGRRLAGLI